MRFNIFLFLILFCLSSCHRQKSYIKNYLPQKFNSILVATEMGSSFCSDCKKCKSVFNLDLAKYDKAITASGLDSLLFYDYYKCVNLTTPLDKEKSYILEFLRNKTIYKLDAIIDFKNIDTTFYQSLPMNGKTHLLHLRFKKFSNQNNIQRETELLFNTHKPSGILVDGKITPTILNALSKGIGQNEKLEYLSVNNVDKNITVEDFEEFLYAIGQHKYLYGVNLDVEGLETPIAYFQVLDSIRNIKYFNLKTPSIPPKLGDLDQLQELHLQTTQKDTLPNTINHLKNLKSLYIRGEDAIVPPLTNLNKLNKLFVISNHSLPGNLEKLENLQHLVYKTSPSEYEIKYPVFPSNLVELQINGDPFFTGKQLETSIKNLKKLSILDLANCGITSIPETLFNLKNLTILNLKGNPINEENIKALQQALPDTKITF